ARPTRTPRHSLSARSGLPPARALPSTSAFSRDCPSVARSFAPEPCCPALSAEDVLLDLAFGWTLRSRPAAGQPCDAAPTCHCAGRGVLPDTHNNSGCPACKRPCHSEGHVAAKRQVEDPGLTDIERDRAGCCCNGDGIIDQPADLDRAAP